MKVLLGVLLVLSLAGNLYLGFLLVDAGIIVDNAQTVAEDLWDRRQLALDIMKRDWVGRSASEVVRRWGRRGGGGPGQQSRTGTLTRGGGAECVKADGGSGVAVRAKSARGELMRRAIG